MAIRMTYITYTAEAHRAIIEGRQNREPVMQTSSMLPILKMPLNAT